MLRSDAPHHTHWLRGSESAKAHVFEPPLDDALCPVLLQTRAANLLDSIRTACAFWRVLLVLSSRQAFLQESNANFIFFEGGSFCTVRLVVRAPVTGPALGFKAGGSLISSRGAARAAKRGPRTPGSLSSGKVPGLAGPPLNSTGALLI